MFILRHCYNLILLLALPFVFIRLFIKSFKMPAYRERWLERLGIFLEKPVTGGIWVHCVSVGELMAALPFIRMLQIIYPRRAITVTTMTPTSSKRLQAIFGSSVFHVYLPYDFNFAVKMFFERVHPRFCIIFETELWPNVIHYCNKREVPVLLANARISPTSMQRYRLIAPVTKYMLNSIDYIAAQSPQDAKRFAGLGCDKSKLHEIGNTKFDVNQEPTEQEAKIIAALKEQIKARPVLVAASTHNGEEEVVLQAFTSLAQEFIDLLLIIVPRYPQRFPDVTEMVAQTGKKFVSRSSGAQITSDTNILVGDTLGELRIFYHLASIAFIGGSLVPIGGHNMLEAGACSVPSLTGPHLHHFEQISKTLLEADAMRVVNDVTGFISVTKAWLADPEAAKQIGANAVKVIAEHRGVTQKLAELVGDISKKHNINLS